MNDKKSLRTRNLIISIVLLAVSLMSIGVIFAASLFTYAQLKANTITLKAESVFSYAAATTEAKFTKPGDTIDIKINTNNSTVSVLELSYSLKVTEDTSGADTEDTSDDDLLSSAILVYLTKNATVENNKVTSSGFKKEYLGTLAEITANGGKDIEGSLVKAAETSDGTANGEMTDVITLELHLGASDSIYEGKSVTVTTTATTTSADYYGNIFVTTPDELAGAIDDINSGFFASGEEPAIVLMNDVEFTASRTVTAACNINLNGYNLTLGDGSLAIDGREAYVWFAGEGTADPTGISIKTYDSATIKEKLLAAAKEELAKGVSAGGEIDLFGNNKFYLGLDSTNLTVEKGTDSANYTYTGVTNSDSGYTGGVVKAEKEDGTTPDRSSVENIKVLGQSIEFRVFDSAHDLAEKYLKNVPNVTGDETPTVSYDIYLPTSITSEGATIEWTSSNPLVMDNAGHIINTDADCDVTLYAAITVNGVTHTESFTFHVLISTQEINFYKLVAKMSPVIIYEQGVLSSAENTSTGLYNLPTTDSGKYNYQKEYITPSKSTKWSDVGIEGGENGEKRFFNYPGYSDIYLTALEYSDVYKDDNTTKEYSFISVGKYGETTVNDTPDEKVPTDGGEYFVYQNTATISNYAEIEVTGTFEGGRSYSSRIIVVIASGADTTIYDTALKSTQSALDNVNILKNILSSRVASGMANENGDFYLPAEYAHAEGYTIALSYSFDPSDENNVIHSIDNAVYYCVQNKSGVWEYSSSYNAATENAAKCYKISVDPTLFGDTERDDVKVSVTMSYASLSERTSTLYFTVPAAVHTSDLGNASIFNSIKYQVYEQLPSAEKTGDGTLSGTTACGFSVDTTSGYITNITGDYILLRDIVGDKEYLAADNAYTILKSYTEQGSDPAWYVDDGQASWYIADDNSYYYSGITKDSTNTYSAYAGCEELWFYTLDSSKASDTYTDSAARDFAALINWATGDTAGIAASTVILEANKSKLTLDGTDYSAKTSDGKEYLTDDEIAVLKAYYMAATSKDETEWRTLWSKVSELAPGYVITDGAAIESAAGTLSGGDSDTYYKYSEVIQWATDFRNNDFDPGNTYTSYLNNFPGVDEDSEKYKYIDGVSLATDYFRNELISFTSSEENTYPATINVTYSKTYLSESGKQKSQDVSGTYTYLTTINKGDGTYVHWYYDSGTAKYGNIAEMKYNAYTVTYKTATGSNGKTITLEDQSIPNYLDDDTEYISPGEMQVLFAFWYSQKGANATDYIQAFYDSTVIPTYFTDEGVQLLMEDFYDNSGINSKTSGESLSFTTAATTASKLLSENGDGAEKLGDSSSSTQNDGYYIPAVTNLDSLSEALQYFTELKVLYIHGTGDYNVNTVTDSTTGTTTTTLGEGGYYGLPAFLSEYGLTSALSRVRMRAVDDGKNTIKTLVLEHVADNYVTFSLSDIKEFDSLKQVDVSDNEGITNVNPLVNYLSDGYTYVDLSKTSVTEELYQYAINNLGHDSSDSSGVASGIYYGETTREAKSGRNASTISYPSELERLIAENMYLTTEVYDSSSSETVYWRIESGNKITYVSAAAYVEDSDKIETADKMQSLLSPYYYVKEATTINDTGYAAGTVLRFTYFSDGTYSVAEAVTVKDESGASVNISVAASADDSGPEDSEISTETTYSSDETPSSDTEIEAVKKVAATATGEEGTGEGSATKDSTTYTDTVYITDKGITLTVKFICYKLNYYKDKDPTKMYLYNNNGTLDAAAYSEDISESSKVCFVRMNDDFSSTDTSGNVNTVDCHNLISYLGSTYNGTDKRRESSSSAWENITDWSNNQTITIGQTLTDDGYTKGSYYNQLVYFPATGHYLNSVSATKEAFKTTAATGSATRSNSSYTYTCNFDAVCYAVKYDEASTTAAGETREGKCRIVCGDNDSASSNEKKLAVKIPEADSTNKTVTAGNRNCYFYKNDTTPAITVTYTVSDGKTATATYNADEFGVEIIKTTTSYTKSVTEAIAGQSKLMYYWGTTTGSDGNSYSYPTVYERVYSVAAASRSGTATYNKEEYSYRFWYKAGSSGTEKKYEFTDSSGATISHSAITHITDSNGAEITVSDGKITVVVSGNTVATITVTETDEVTKISYGEKTYTDSSADTPASTVWTSITVNGETTNYTGTTDENGNVTTATELAEAAWEKLKAWTYDASDDKAYISYVPEYSENALKTQAARIGGYIQYTGADVTEGETIGTATYYKERTTSTAASYTKDGYYYMSVSDGALTWNNVDSSTISTDKSKTMNGILETANEHFGDLEYGEYYGMYYAYGGESDGKYTNGTIYRIMPNAANSAFVYVTANATASTGYYYCEKSFTYTADNKTYAFTSGSVYKLTFNENGDITASEDTNYSGVIKESPATESDPASDGYIEDTNQEAKTATYATVTVGNATFNCFKLLAVNYYMVAGTEALIGVGDWETEKIESGCDEWCILSEEDYEKLVNGEATSTTLGISADTDLTEKNSLTIDADGNITGKACSYYLYNPTEQVFVSSNLARGTGWNYGKVGVVTLAASVADKDTTKNTPSNEADRVRFYIADTSDYKAVNGNGKYAFIAAYGNVITADAETSTTVTNALTSSGNEGWHPVLRNTWPSFGGTGLVNDKYGASNTFTFTSVGTTVAAAPFKVEVKNSEGTTTTYTVTDNLKVKAELTGTTYSKTNTYYYDRKVEAWKYSYVDTTAAEIKYYIDDTEIADAVFSLTWTKTNNDNGTYTTADVEKHYTENEKNGLAPVKQGDGLSAVSLLSADQLSSGDFGLEYDKFYDATYEASQIMINLANDSWNGQSNEDMKNRIFYINSTSELEADRYIKNGAFYTIWYDEEQGTYSLKTVGDIDYSIDSATGDDGTVAYSKAEFINLRMLTVLDKLDKLVGGEGWVGNNGNSAHTGTGGTYDAVVSVFTHKTTDENGNSNGTDPTNGKQIYSDDVRKYQVEVVG